MINKINFTGLKLKNQNTKMVLASYMRRGEAEQAAIERGLAILNQTAGDTNMTLSAAYVPRGQEVSSKPSGHKLTITSPDSTVASQCFISEYDIATTIARRFVKMNSDVEGVVEKSSIDDILDRYM